MLLEYDILIEVSANNLYQLRLDSSAEQITSSFSS